MAMPGRCMNESAFMTPPRDTVSKVSADAQPEGASSPPLTSSRPHRSFNRWGFRIFGRSTRLRSSASKNAARSAPLTERPVSTGVPLALRANSCGTAFRSSLPIALGLLSTSSSGPPEWMGDVVTRTTSSLYRVGLIGSPPWRSLWTATSDWRWLVLLGWRRATSPDCGRFAFSDWRRVTSPDLRWNAGELRL